MSPSLVSIAGANRDPRQQAGTVGIGRLQPLGHAPVRLHPLSRRELLIEVTSERIRDKIAASKRKGLWVGVPSGYEMKEDKVAVVEVEAERVRLIYARYLELSGPNKAKASRERCDPRRHFLRAWLSVLSVK